MFLKIGDSHRRDDFKHFTDEGFNKLGHNWECYLFQLDTGKTKKVVRLNENPCIFDWMKTHVYLVHTIHKHLFLVRQDTGEMGALQTAFPFSCIPRSSMGKVLVALPLKFVPAIVTCLRVWEETRMGLLNSSISFKLGSLIQKFIDIPSHINAMSLKQGIHQFWLQWQRNHDKESPGDSCQMSDNTS